MELYADTATSNVVFYVNGIKVVEKNAQPEWTLLFYLRNKLRLTGTKLGCGEGGCGACTVMVSRYDRQKQHIAHYAVNACLTPICVLHGLAVTTVEGVGNTKRLHAVQERLAKAHGSQCGFCTPGFVMSMYTLLRNTTLPTFAQVEEGFQGNLCRCTGYRPILEGYKTFTKEFSEAAGCCGGKVNGVCCMSNGGGNGNCLTTENGYTVNESVATSLTPTDFPQYDPSQEPIFPPELQLSDTYDTEYLVIPGEKITWYRPTTMEQLLNLKANFPHAKLVVGNTEVALEMKFKQCDYPVIIHPTMIPEMVGVTITDNGFVFGGSVTLSTMEHVLLEEIRESPEHETRVYAAICEMLHWFAGKQIRNVAAIAGNIITSSPISDLNPLLMAAGSILELRSSQGTRFVKMDHQFFTGYRNNIVRPEEILVSVTVPKTQENEYFFGFKQARRRDDDISIVNAGCKVVFEPDSNIIADIRLAFGGMAPTTVMALKTMDALVGRAWDQSLVDDACRLLLEDLPLPPAAPGGMAAYRQSLCLSFFFKFYVAVLRKLTQRGNCSEEIPPSLGSVIEDIPRGEVKSAQLYELVPEGQHDYDPVGRPLPHASALKHVTGEAIYCDDMPKMENELYMGLVLSTKAHARITSIDPAVALAMPGVRDFLCAKDVSNNSTGPVIHDEEVFASEKVTCFGQIIGCIVADNQAIAQRAAKAVKVVYEDLSPLIVTIEDAIEHKSFFHDHVRSIVNGDVEEGFKMADHIIEDTFQMAGQEHFYLETQVVIAVPKEDDEMEIFSSTQNPTEVQFLAASALGIPANKVVCRVKRMGGGFGGKETRACVVAVPAAVAAAKLKRSVRCMLDRDEDMILTGTRHPFRANYKVGFTKEGKIVALQIEMYSNGGNSLDLSRGIMERALFHMENAYRIPHVKAVGYVCKTNLPSNTAFRGFGGPQGMLICENWMNDIATYLNMEPETVRALNLYQDGDATPYNQQLENCTIRRCWEECKRMSKYEEKRKQIEAFNQVNRYKKRGISLIPTKFGISFTTLFLNQTGALVHVYKDGSVLISHGGTEMGQGLHIKMIQVASRALGIPHTKIYIAETSTDKVPNTPPTAASVGSDINGMAVLNACNIIMERLEPVIQENPKGKWEDWVLKAFFQRISLSAAGFYKTPDIGYSFDTNTGKAFNYFTYGVACSEVEIDCLTGNHRVLRTDIVMDLGESLNPAIDIGQVEGGFVQGLGLFTLEEPLFSPSGIIITRGPSTYKIPACDDIPTEFNVSLLRGCPNPRAVYSSKAVGEPPLFLASSVFFAIKDAISQARKEAGLSGKFQLYSPATAERIRMACEDQFTNQVPKPTPGTFKPWAVSV